MKKDLERMQYQQQTQAMTAKKEEALVKAIGELSKHIKEREMELTTRTRTTEKLKQLFSEKKKDCFTRSRLPVKIDYVIPLTRIEKNDNMNDFKTKAKTGKDFAIILFDKVAEDVENTIIEISLDGMSLKTYLCEDSDTSLTIQPLSEGGYTYKITQLVNGNAYVSEGDFAIVSDIQSGSETRHIPFYEKFDKSDYYELVKFILPEWVTEGEEIHLAWKLEPELFENIHLGTRKCKESMKLIRNECLTPTTSDVSFSIQEFSDAMIYLEFMLKNGQIFGIKINGVMSEVHNIPYDRNAPKSYSIMWSQHWEDCGETQRVEVTNVVDVQDPRSNYRSNYIPHL